MNGYFKVPTGKKTLKYAARFYFKYDFILMHC